MTTHSNISQQTPAEIDAAWLTAVTPANRKRERANQLDGTAAKYAKYGGTYQPQANRYAEQAQELRTEANAEYKLAAAPFLAEWDARGGWNRAYIVPGGHIHKSTACHTLHPTTLISWLPELSGHSEDEIVEHAGVNACTVCYPSAPVEALRAAELAAKREGECPGSRSYEHDSSGVRYHSPRAKCNHCRQTISLTSTGKMRAHKAVQS